MTVGKKWMRIGMLCALCMLLTGCLFRSPTDLYAQLHLYIPLMAVNMLYTRSVGFSSIVNPVATVVDALGSTVGFGLVICAISALREMAVQGTLWGVSMGWDTTLSTTSAPFAAFLLLGFMAALLQWSRQRISAFFHRKEADEE